MNKMYKLRFYHKNGPEKGNTEKEVFFDTFKELKREYRKVFCPEDYTYNPTAWGFLGKEWRRIPDGKLGSKEDYPRKRLFWDMDGTLAKWNTAATVEDLYSKGYFLNREPEEDLCFLAGLLSGGIESYILTACMAGSDYLIPEKKIWIKKEIPMLRHRILFVPCGVSKADFVRDMFREDLCTEDILIDDHSPNLIKWEEAGGQGVKWINGINNSAKSGFSGARCDSSSDLFAVII